MSKPVIKNDSFEALHKLPETDEKRVNPFIDAEIEKHLDDPNSLISRESYEYLKLLQKHAPERKKTLALGANEDVIVVPGFLGSRLADVKGGNGLIWVDPFLVTHPDQLTALKLGDVTSLGKEKEANEQFQVQATGFIPLIYDVLSVRLWWSGYKVEHFPVDWRKNLDEAADELKNKILNRIGKTSRALHLIAHSQGSLVARRALQLLGETQAKKLVKSLVLLGPATYGTYSAVFALSGSHESFETAKQFGVNLPDNIADTFQSFSGLYQLIPSLNLDITNKFQPLDIDKLSGATKEIPTNIFEEIFWESGIDKTRLKDFKGWARKIDTEFFNSKTTIVLGQDKTITKVEWQGNKLVPTKTELVGDGTVPDEWAKLKGVRTYKIKDLSHTRIPSSITAIEMINGFLQGKFPVENRVQLKAKESVDIEETPVFENRDKDLLKKKIEIFEGKKNRNSPIDSPQKKSRNIQKEPPTELLSKRLQIPSPDNRKLRVYSFDPLLSGKLEDMSIAELILEIPWEDQSKLLPGPIGEYIEVIDYDPASNCFYPPIDLWSPEILAQSGMPASESHPMFHQQMVYAVAMSTIHTFEKALGRVALWSTHNTYDEKGKHLEMTNEQLFVKRLRIYPHAMRSDNAYYDPAKKALLFGYFPSRDEVGGKTIPNGTIFTCLSYDIIAHETTHALLDGLHPYLIENSNPDCHAFHEAFADIVALFQHFSHREVLRTQIARGRGDLNAQTLLGQLAQQFGEAQGEHQGALRKYLGQINFDGTFKPIAPNPNLYSESIEAHDRGAILVAAMFQAFINIYNFRTRDLNRIASAGTGILNEGEILPDLANRLAQEAAKSAAHLLNMAVRAIDYIPPVDLTFGEYLRALITADYDLMQDADKSYRVAVIDAFRQWGIYPSDVNTLDQAALLWRKPEYEVPEKVKSLIKDLEIKEWDLDADRFEVFENSEKNRLKLHKWLYDKLILQDGGKMLGVMVIPNTENYPNGLHSIPRNKDYEPVFNINSIRPCRRIGRDGQAQVDLVVEITQKRAGYLDEEMQKKIDMGPGDNLYWAFEEYQLWGDEGKKKEDRIMVEEPPDFWFMGGSTLIVNPKTGEIRYIIRKSIYSDDDYRLKRQRKYEEGGGMLSLHENYFKQNKEKAFALLHQEHD